MRWLRFLADGKEHTGYLDKEQVKVVSGDIYSGDYRETGETFSMDQIEWLPPCQPGKIIGIGLNYKDHAKEMKMAIPSEPVVFLKADTSLLPHMGVIIHPAISKRMDYEAELAVVIGKKARNISEQDALTYVFGYTCNNDVTARDLQKLEGQWSLSKSFDTFCPLGPWIETDVDASDLEITLSVNGKIQQHSRTSQLAYGIGALVSFLSSVMTLLPGDVILTGTPSGIGAIKPGDQVTVSIENVGELTNTVGASE